MTDFKNQNNLDSTQKYSPLISDYDDTSNNITPEPQIIQANITPEENNLNNSGEYIIYKITDTCDQICGYILYLYC